MSYLFLALALFAGAAKGFCGKKSSSVLSGIKDMALANVIRMCICMAVGIIIIALGGNIGQIVPTAKLIAISALSGISTAVFVVAWMVSVRKSAYMLIDVFLMLGVLIPLICGMVFWGEPVKPTQWVGIAVLFAAVVIMCSYNNSIKQKITFSSLIVLIISGVAGGITDLSQKLFVKQLPSFDVGVFNFYTYLFAAVTLLIACAFMPRDEKISDSKAFIKVIGYITVMAVCLFANSYFKTLASRNLDAVLLYPLNQGAALILSSVMSAAFFKEKLTTKGALGIALSFVGLIIINVI